MNGWLGRRLAAALMAAALGVASGAAHAAVDANTATPEQLDAIRGIGPALAARIVQERARRPFRDLADLQERVRGIGPAVARKLAADGLTVGGMPGAATAAATGTAAAAVGSAAGSGSGSRAVGQAGPGAAGATPRSAGAASRSAGAASGAAAARPVAGSAASGPVIDVAPLVTTPVGRGSLTERRPAP